MLWLSVLSLGMIYISDETGPTLAAHQDEVMRFGSAGRDE